MNATTSKSAAMPLSGIKGTPDSAAAFLVNPHHTSSEVLTEPGADLSITVKNGVATLSGSTDSAAEANMAEYLVSRLKGVETVINLIAHQ